MIYVKYNEDGTVKSFIVTCSCSCNNSIEFKILDNNVYASAAKGSFYAYQRMCIEQDKLLLIKEKVKRTIIKGYNAIVENVPEMKKVKPSNLCLCDCMLDKKEIPEFLAALNGLKLTEDCERDYDNESELAMFKEKIFDDSGFDIFGIYIRPKTDSIIPELKGITHRNYEVIYNKDDWDKFVAKCNKFLKGVV